MISALPDIKVLTINDDHDFMVIACDGIWYVMRERLCLLGHHYPACSLELGLRKFQGAWLQPLFSQRVSSFSEELFSDGGTSQCAEL